MPRIVNPFITGNPVPPEKSIGRQREANTILSLLAGPGRGSSAVSGEPRIGKTSLLHYIAEPSIAKKYGLTPDWCIFVDVNCQSVTPFTATYFWQRAFRAMRKVADDELRKEIEQIWEQEEITREDLEDFFDEIAAKRRLIVLVLDEFHAIIEGVSANVLLQFFNTLRTLINRPSRGLALVVASREPLYEMCRGIRFAGSPFYNNFTFVHLKKFTREEAEELIDKYLTGTGITFDQEDREFLWQVSEAGHPYLLQVACFKLFEAKLSGKVP